MMRSMLGPVVRRLKWITCTGLLVALALLGLAPTKAAAQGPDLLRIRIKETIEINRVGDGKVAIEVKLPASAYTQLKKKTPNMAVLLREIGPNNLGWHEIQDIRGNWDDAASSVLFSCTTRGMARMGRDQFWEVPVASVVDLDLSANHEHVAVLTAAVPVGDFGLATQTSRVVLPAGSTGVKLLKGPNRLAFRMPAAAPEGTNPDASFDFEARAQLMSCLAKTYGNPKFAQLWVGRSVFKNTGDQTLRDFRVRFHIAEYTPTWGPWNVCPQVVPGQTVADAYFPVFDLDKVARLNGACQAMLEVQYQYRRPDGRLVEETDSKQLQILARNQVYFSNLKSEDMIGFDDVFNLVPAVLASFVTHEDPVVQQVAGWVSGLSGGGLASGAAASLDDKEAANFFQALYEFMAGNGIAYQTPPGSVLEGNAVQHVKYGRDVLRNRAGCCIDLSIFMGSVCEAVGLEPVLIVVPGHCVPAIYLPKSRKLVVIEATAVGKHSFEEALKKGAELQKAIGEGRVPAITADIRKLRSLGVHALELPAVPNDILEKWNIKPVRQQRTQAASRPDKDRAAQSNASPQANQESNPRPNPQPSPEPAPRTNTTQSLIGTWKAVVEYQGQRYTQVMQFKADGTFELRSVWETGQQVTNGTYQYDNGGLALTYNGVTRRSSIQWTDANTILYTNSQQVQIQYTRAP